MMNYRVMTALYAFAAGALLMVMPGIAQAIEMHEREYGKPVPWQIDLQLGVTPVMHMLADLHWMLLVIITVITVFVVALMVYVCWRFAAKRNPVPSKTSHNTLIEIIWTAVPVMILVVVAIPTLKSLYFIDKIEHPDMTIKVVGHQWYWNYQYPDHGGFTFDSYMKAESELLPGELRLLEVDNRIVVPVNKTVRLEMTAADVNHNWAMPAFGIKQDVIPGKLTEAWFRAERVGVYYGQCSELCGVRHGFMPIAVEVVEQRAFDAWIERAKAEYAQHGDVPESPIRAAAIEKQNSLALAE